MSDILLYFFVSHLMVGVISLFFGVLVLINGRSKINIIFALLMVAVSLWSLFYAIWLSSDNPESALFFSTTLNVATIFIPVLYLHWVLLFLNKNNKKIIIPMYLVSVVFLFFGYSELFVSGVVPVMFFPYYPQSGIIHSIFLIMWGFAVIYSWVAIYLKLRKSNGVKKKLLFIVLIGSLIGFIGGSFNFLLMFGIGVVAPFVSALVILVPIMSGYAMMKYNFMDIRLVFIQLLIILLNAFAIGFIFLSSSVGEYIAKIIFALMTMVVSYLLKKSYDKEVEQKEELEKASRDLKRANAELKRLDKAKSEFISIASHQLRTPLTAIKGYVSLILEGAYGKNSEETDGALNKIFLANDRLIQLVEDLLNITRIESGRLEYHMEDNVQMDDILKELEDMFILRTKEKGLEFVVKTMDGKAPPVKADKSKLREVISNTIDNAIKYTKEGFIHVSMEKDDGILRVMVEDSGVGISKESLNSLFTKFSRGTDDTKMYTEGTGLGLYVGKNLIESQGGRIYAESDGLGKGSRFIIEMPIVK